MGVPAASRSKPQGWARGGHWPLTPGARQVPELGTGNALGALLPSLLWQERQQWVRQEEMMLLSHHQLVSGGGEDRLCDGEKPHLEWCCKQELLMVC